MSQPVQFGHFYQHTVEQDINSIKNVTPEAGERQRSGKYPSSGGAGIKRARRRTSKVLPNPPTWTPVITRPRLSAPPTRADHHGITCSAALHSSRAPPRAFLSSLRDKGLGPQDPELTVYFRSSRKPEIHLHALTTSYSFPPRPSARHLHGSAPRFLIFTTRDLAHMPRC